MSLSLRTILDHLPAANQAFLLAGLFIGLSLWLLGRRMARLSCALLGLLAGFCVGIAIAAAAGRGELALVALVATSFMGLALAWALFRVWMSLGLACILALAAPLAAAVWQGGLDRLLLGSDDSRAKAAQLDPAAFSPTPITPPAPAPFAQSITPNASAPQPPATALDDLVLAGGVRVPGLIIDLPNPADLGLANPLARPSPTDRPRQPRALAAPGQGIALALAAPRGPDASAASHSDPRESLAWVDDPTGLADQLAQDLAAVAPAFDTPAVAPGIAGLHALAQRQIDALRDGWRGLDPGFRHLAAALAGAGAVAGLVVGLLWPGVAAALQSSLVGSVIMLLAGSRLLAGVVPPYLAQWTTHPKALILGAGLITALGVLLQCTIIRRQADR